MTSHPGRSPVRAAERSRARAALSRLPGWVTALGVVLVLGELTSAVLLAGRPGGLAAGLSSGPRTVVLKVENAYNGDTATYTSPAGDGQFDMPGETPPLGQGGYSESGPTLTKTLAVRAGETVTISTFNGYGGSPLTCSITVGGVVLSRMAADDFWGRATCRARIP